MGSRWRPPGRVGSTRPGRQQLVVRDSTVCCWVWLWPKTTSDCSPGPCRSTTWSAVRSSLAGHLAELLDRLGAAIGRLSRPQSIQSWRDAIAAATDSLATVAPSDAWQRDQLYRLLDEVVDEATPAAIAGAGTEPTSTVSTTRLDLSEARSLLSRRLQGRPTRANFRTGDLTVCTLVPMRSVPHRVVGLLGLDDGVFPRHTERDGDDLLSSDPQVGDRVARNEDRQLLLDAVLAATEHLVITFSGRDERTNRERPPAVPIAELLDVVDRTVRAPGDSVAARHTVLVRHPLQSFDPRNFMAGPDGGSPQSFDPVNLDGAVGAVRSPATPSGVPDRLSGPDGRRGRPARLADPFCGTSGQVVLA